MAPATIQLRDYQREALESIEEAQARGVRRPLLVLPTGCGKTVVFSRPVAEAVRNGGSALILAHRDELLDQAAAKLIELAPELEMAVGKVKGARNDVRASAVVGSVQTLARERRLAQLPRRFDIVVVDEAHHAAAESYVRILDHVADSPLILGVTATPERADRLRLDEVWDEVVYQKGIEEMIRRGYLCNLRGVRVGLADLDLRTVKKSRGDYAPGDLGRHLEAAGAPDHAVAAYREHAAGRRAVVFVPTVSLADEFAMAFEDAGVAAAALNGKTEEGHRREILRKLGTGELQVVVNVGVLTEGFDEPSIGCIMIARPTKSRGLYVQMVGRGTRLYPGKDDCIVLDLVGVTEELSLQSLPAVFGLEPEQLQDGQAITDALDAAAGGGPGSATGRDGHRTSRDVELFNRAKLNWLQTTEGDWYLSAGSGELLALLEDGRGTFDVCLVGQRTFRRCAQRLDLGYAQGLAEDVVRQREAGAVSSRAAAWRRAPATAGQRRLLHSRRVPVSPDLTKGGAADLIARTFANERLPRVRAKLRALRATDQGGHDGEREPAAA